MGDNAAWVDIELPQAPAAVLAELRDIGRLLRLNPHLDIARFEREADGLYRLEGLNEMNGLAVSCRLTFRDEGADGFRLDYDSGLKLATQVRAAPRSGGTLLTIRESYRQPQDEAELAQVDRSLTAWGASIRRHFLGCARWRWLPGYRHWRERLWLEMRPRERRLTRMIAWVSIIEFAVFLAALWVYV